MRRRRSEERGVERVCEEGLEEQEVEEEEEEEEGEEGEEEEEEETDHHDDDDGGCCFGGGARARAGARDPSQFWAWRGRARGGLASSACDILATLGSDMLRVRLSGQFRLRHPHNSGFGAAARKVVQPVPFVTSLDAARELAWPISLETSSQLWVQSWCTRGGPASSA